MTDTSNAPETVWISDIPYDLGRSGDLEAMGFAWNKEHGRNPVEYTRTDAITPQQAAKVLGLDNGRAESVRKALGLLNAMVRGGENHSTQTEEILKAARGIILAAERAIAEQEDKP